MDQPAVYRPTDLDEDEVTLLGVLSLGLPPSRAAGSDTFRADYCAAVVAGLQEDGERTHLNAGRSGPAPAYRARLAAAIESLRDKGIVADSPRGMPAAPGQFEAGLAIDVVEPDAQPAVLDRFLAQQCMEHLLNIPAVYPFLMERYAAAGEVWRRLRDEGYGR